MGLGKLRPRRELVYTTTESIERIERSIRVIRSADDDDELRVGSEWETVTD